ncbi:MAG: DNA polymerase III subunit delta [Coriobacteriales bacterium]
MAKSKALLPVYLFIGEDSLKRKALLKRMQERVAEKGDLALNQTNFDAQEVDPPGEVVAACNTVPFLSDMRLVVVDNIGHAKKDLLDSICDYLDAPTDSTVLVMTGNSLAKNTKLYKKVHKLYPKAYISCDLKKRRSDIADFVRRLVKSANAEIEPDAVDAMVDMVGNSTVALNSEVKKLCDYLAAQGRDTITLEDVESMVTRISSPKPWDLTAALGERDAGKCMKLLEIMGDQAELGLLTMCEKRIRELIVTKAMDSRPVRAPLEEVLGGSSFMYRNHYRYAARFKQDELEEALDRAAQCEMEIKRGADPKLSLEMWILGVCTGKWATGE